MSGPDYDEFFGSTNASFDGGLNDTTLLDTPWPSTPEAEARDRRHSELRLAVQTADEEASKQLRRCRKRVDKAYAKYEEAKAKEGKNAGATKLAQQRLLERKTEHFHAVEHSAKTRRLLAGLEEQKSFTKMPSGFPTLRASLNLTREVVQTYLRKLEQFLDAAAFPQQEHGIHRWSKLLSQCVTNHRKEDAQFLATLAGKPWDMARVEFEERFARKSDSFALAAKLLKASQDPAEDVLGYGERFGHAIDACFTDLDLEKARWLKRQPLMLYLFANGLASSLQESVLADKAFRHANSLDDMVHLAQGCERVADRKKAFAKASEGGHDQGRQSQGGKSTTKESAGTGQNQGGFSGKGGGRRSKFGGQPAGQPNGQAAHAKKDDTSASGAPDNAVKNGDAGACARCGRGHAGTCRAEFHNDGTRIPGVPPGKPPDWKSNYKGCQACGSLAHLMKACKDKRADMDAPAVRAIHARIMELKAQQGAAPHASPAKKRRVEVSFPEEASSEDETAHADLYGCAVCGHGGHDAESCPER